MVLANLLSAGVSIIDALDISSKVTNNILVREGIDRVKMEILEEKVYHNYLPKNLFSQWSFQSL